MWHVLAIERCDGMEYSVILRAISVVWNADCSCSPSKKKNENSHPRRDSIEGARGRLGWRVWCSIGLSS